MTDKHDLSLKIGSWFDAKASGWGIVALTLIVALVLLVVLTGTGGHLGALVSAVRGPSDRPVAAASAAASASVVGPGVPAVLAQAK